MKRLSVFLLALVPVLARAHEGHGAGGWLHALEGEHLVPALLLVAAAIVMLGLARKRLLSKHR